MGEGGGGGHENRAMTTGLAGITRPSNRITCFPTVRERCQPVLLGILARRMELAFGVWGRQANDPQQDR